jgi:hemerythrin-like metal-binding protein
VGSGVLTMLVLQNWMAVFSGLTLFSAGGIVWLSRYFNRRELKRSVGMSRLEDIDEADPKTAGLMQISWRSSFECGHEVIDGQHRRLFGISNELIDSVLSNRPHHETETLLGKLVTDTEEHFLTEETILVRAGHPLSAEHREHHAALLNKAKLLLKQFHDNQIGAGELIAFLTVDVITNHILKEDLKFATSERVSVGL